MSYNDLFSIPVSQRKQVSMRRKFIIFSSALFLFIFILGSAAFVFLMRRIMHDNTEYELKQTVEIEKFKLEAQVNSEIAVVRKMAASPLIQQFFLNPENEEVAKIALQDIEEYRRIFVSKSLFWINDADKKIYIDNVYAYTLNPDDPDYYWYNMTMHETLSYNINIGYNSNLKITNLWINAPVFDKEKNAVGVLGTGIRLSDFINVIFQNYSRQADLYFFNAAGEITGALDVELVANKVLLDAELGQAGREILAGTVNLKDVETKYFDIQNGKGIAAFCYIPALDWYVTAVHRFTISDSLHTGMTFLFGVMMAVIFTIFVVINIFTLKLLEPLGRLIGTLGKISNEWDLKTRDELKQKDEVETLGEFLNMTIIDPLTGLYNRRFMSGNMKKIIKSLSRSNGKLSLLFIDIDFFKKYNDTYGHDIGDNCLKAIANVLSQSVSREDDFVARYGGEEFVVVLPYTGKEGAGVIADRILKRVYECNIPHRESGISDFVTVSIGGTTCTVKHWLSEGDIIKRADEALYVSKNEGRNRYTYKSLDDENA